jgi:hypothetical protein
VILRRAWRGHCPYGYLARACSDGTAMTGSIHDPEPRPAPGAPNPYSHNEIHVLDHARKPLIQCHFQFVGRKVPVTPRRHRLAAAEIAYPLVRACFCLAGFDLAQNVNHLGKPRCGDVVKGAHTGVTRTVAFMTRCHFGDLLGIAIPPLTWGYANLAHRPSGRACGLGSLSQTGFGVTCYQVPQRFSRMVRV